MPIRIVIEHYHHLVEPPSQVTARDLNDIATRLRNSNDALEEAMASVDPTNSGTRGRVNRGDCDMSADSIAQALENVRVETERNESLDQGASELFDKLATIIEENKGDPTAIQAIADRLRTSNDALAQAIVARTPADPSGGGSGEGGSSARRS